MNSKKSDKFQTYLVIKTLRVIAVCATATEDDFYLPINCGFMIWFYCSKNH